MSLSHNDTDNVRETKEGTVRHVGKSSRYGLHLALSPVWECREWRWRWKECGRKANYIGKRSTISVKFYWARNTGSTGESSDWWSSPRLPHTCEIYDGRGSNNSPTHFVNGVTSTVANANIGTLRKNKKEKSSRGLVQTGAGRAVLSLALFSPFISMFRSPALFASPHTPPTSYSALPLNIGRAVTLNRADLRPMRLPNDSLLLLWGDASFIS